MKLIVSELAALEGYVSREFYYIMTDLMEHHGWRHIDTWKLFRAPGSFRQRLLDAFGELPAMIMFWEGYHLLCTYAAEIFRLDCHKAIWIDDLHCWSEPMRQGRLASFAICQTILSSYAYVWPKFYPELTSAGKQLVWIPHSASPEFMLDYNPHPDNAILLSGVIDRHYPLREQLKHLHTQGCPLITYHCHPGYHCSYDHRADQNVGRGYAEKINSHRIGFTDSAIYEYVLAKYFEIPATGALLLADDAVRAPLKELGFIEDVHYIATSKANLNEQVRYVLDESNHEQLNEIRRRGQQLVWDRHTTSDRARRINEVCTQAAA